MSELRAKIKQITSSKVWKRLRPFLIALVSLLIVYIIISTLFTTIVQKYLSPVDPKDATPIEFVLEEGWGASTVAKHLYEACGEGEPGLISNKAVFKIYVDFMGKTQELRAGRYYLSKNMDIPTIIDVLCSGSGEDLNVVTVTIREGATVQDIVKVLKDSGMNIEEDTFLNLCKSGASFESYPFIKNVLIADEDRFYNLEGYLFPDTYQFRTTASSETVLRKLLDRLNDIWYNSEDDFQARADALGMSMDEVLSLAALIQREAVLEGDFYKVSAVFHNRLEQGMRLQSDAPLSYIFGENTLSFTMDQINYDSEYNTYVYKGVPLGPICNPGRLAIEAALNPDPEYLNEGYLFFCLMDGKTGALCYAKTNEEHENNVNKYKQYW